VTRIITAEQLSKLRVGDSVYMPIPEGAEIYNSGFRPDFSYFYSYKYDDPNVPEPTVTVSVGLVK
jgi:hypothetical protein